MTKRWLIRGLFLLPVVLCLAGWGWSGWYEGRVYCDRGHSWIYLHTETGAVYLVGGWGTQESDHYFAYVYRTVSVRFWPEPRDDGICFLGFRWFHYIYTDPGGPVHTAYALAIPYWFPLLVSSLLLLGAWRKTRSRPDPATAFPVVMKEPTSAED